MKLHYTELSGALFGVVSDDVNTAVLLTRSGTVHEHPVLHNGQANCFTVPTHAVGNGDIYKPSAVLEFKHSILAAAKQRSQGTIEEKPVKTKTPKSKDVVLNKEERKALMVEAKGTENFSQTEEALIQLLLELQTADSTEFKLPEGYQSLLEFKKEKVDMFLQEYLLGMQFDSVHDWIMNERGALEYKDTLERVVSAPM